MNDSCEVKPSHICLKDKEFEEIRKELKETGLDLNTITINMETMQKDIEEIKTSLKEFIKTADDKYAGKWTEKVWIWILWVIGTALIGTLMTLLLK